MEVGTRAMQGKEEGIPMDAPLRAVTMAQPSSSDAVLFHQPPSTLHRQLVYTAMHHSQVMTDEQLETLRRQISVYSTICQQLVEMHKAMVAQQQSSIPGSQFGQSIGFDPAFYSAGHKMASRQRWTPSQTQLQVLESLFEQERGTLSKQMIKDITLELSQHGPISETNVYNWFQNRRARTKRKQQLEGSNNGESELDTDVESPEVKKAKTERDLWSDGLGADLVDMSFQGSHSADHHKSQQGLLQPSQMHIHMNSSAASFERAVDTHGHCFSEEGHLVDCKPWDIPKSVLDIKADLVRPSESQELQERRVLVNGTRKS